MIVSKWQNHMSLPGVQLLLCKASSGEQIQRAVNCSSQASRSCVAPGPINRSLLGLALPQGASILFTHNLDDPAPKLMLRFELSLGHTGTLRGRPPPGYAPFTIFNTRAPTATRRVTGVSMMLIAVSL